jgi:hypothetical protein
MLSGAAMDITGGTLIVSGDVTSTINTYISNGWLTAYDGSGTLNVDYGITNPGKTTVTASTPEKASYPNPTNGATGVDVNADLSFHTMCTSAPISVMSTVPPGCLVIWTEMERLTITTFLFF